MRLAIVIPGDNFNKARSKSQDFIPSVIPQKIRREDPIFAVGYLRTEVGEEPGRCG